MIDLQVAVDKLNGMECEEIRHFLRLEGVKGRTGSSRCPLAVWLQRVTERGDILVGTNMVHRIGDSSKNYELGAGPQWFIHHFDRDDYPELRQPMAPIVR